MEIFQYCLLVNRNGVFVLTAKGILKKIMNNFTTALYGKCTGIVRQNTLKTAATLAICNIASVPICKNVVPLLS